MMKIYRLSSIALPLLVLISSQCSAFNDFERRHNPDNFQISEHGAGYSSQPFMNFEREVDSAINRLYEHDEMFFESGVDFFGGSSAIALHAMIINTKDKSVQLGKTERERIYAIKAFHNEPTFANFSRNALLQQLSGVFSRMNSSYRGLFTDNGRCPGDEAVTCDVQARFRTIDGSCNNLRNPRWGKSFIPMRRFVPPVYADGVSVPRLNGRDGSPLPPVRLVSRELHTSDQSQQASPRMTHMVMQWGQFLDHDLTSTPISKGLNGSTARCCVDDIPDGTSQDVINALLERDICYPIPIPSGDQRFGDRQCMNFVRSIQVANADCRFEPVEQVNQITAFIDASQVYGSTQEEMDKLRMYTAGKMKSHTGSLLPRSDRKNCIPERPNEDFCFDAGDERVNEQMALTSLHTVWIREHNRISEHLTRLNPHWNDERCFQETRKILGAMMQKITYDEFLPALLNMKTREFFNLKSGTWGYMDTYKENVDSSIRNVFATVAFRFGHTLIRGTFSKLISPFMVDGKNQLRELFGNTSIIIHGKGKSISQLMGGMTRDHAHKFDRFLTPDLTQNLFLDTEGHSLDLASLNMQRGRDHGIPGYNAWRKWCKLPVAHHFGTGRGGLVDHPADAARILGSLYRHPDDIDAFAGIMSENLLRDSALGPTVACIIATQFQLAKEGDRFWYETEDDPVRFSVGQLHAIRSASLARVLCDNTDLDVMQPWVMEVPDYLSNPIIRCSGIQGVDLTFWKEIRPFWSTWSEWSECKNGVQNRRRTCSSEHGGCVGPSSQERNCMAFQHLDFGTWDNWTAWSPCRNHRRRRHRRCFLNFQRVDTCIGENRQSSPCPTPHGKFCPFPEYSVAQRACMRSFSSLGNFP